MEQLSTPEDCLELSEDEEYRGILAIGDTHFQHTAFIKGEELITRCLEIAEEVHPAGVLLLGDILDTNDTTKQSPFDQARRLVKSLLPLTKEVIAQMGNHDLINYTQFHSDKHFFNPMKEWAGVTIVDKPTAINFTDITGELHLLVSCPFVPWNRFHESLDTLGEQYVDWTAARCIFAHEDIEGVVHPSAGGIPAPGAKWQKEFPPIISGHIHNECTIGTNVMYTGSSRQVKADESSDKFLWHILFSPPSKKLKGYVKRCNMWIRKIPLNLKGIKEVHHTYDDIHEFDYELLSTSYIKVHLTGTTSQSTAFKKGKVYFELRDAGVTFDFHPIIEVSSLTVMMGLEGSPSPNGEDNESFDNILSSLVKLKSQSVQDAYNELYQIKRRPRLIFIEAPKK